MEDAHFSSTYIILIEIGAFQNADLENALIIVFVCTCHYISLIELLLESVL